ncbi:MAG: PH domain-containing protein [Gemmatimonadota bacterium]
MAVDRGVIDAQLKDIGEGARWWEQREFRDLPYVLHPDEQIHGLLNGKLLGGRRPRLLPARQWLIVATSQRLICLRQERFARRQVEFAAGEIVRLDHRSRLRDYQIVVETPQRRYRIRLPKDQAFRFIGALGPLLPRQRVQPVPPELEPLSWIPGMTTVATLPVVAGIISKVSMLSPPDYSDRDRVERLEGTVERLQSEVEQLQQNVAFLEELLERRANEVALPASRHDS